MSASIDKQTRNQAALAKGLSNQEAVKRPSRVLHNERLAPHRLADAVLAQSLRQLPPTGKVRLALDWTIKENHPLLGFRWSWVAGRSQSIRTYDAKVLKERMRYDAYRQCEYFIGSGAIESTGKQLIPCTLKGQECTGI